MALINSVLSWLMKKRFHQIELFMKYPYEVQDEWFKKLISGGQYSEWGKKYDYASIHNAEIFRQRVPVSDYHDLKPYIDRLRSGEQNVLWNSEIKLFAISSGTTDEKSKWIPVSEEVLDECHYEGGTDMLSMSCNKHPDTLVFEGRGLAMGGRHKLTEINN